MKIKFFFIIMIVLLTFSSCCMPSYIVHDSYVNPSDIKNHSNYDLAGYYNSRNEREVIFRNNIPLYRVYNWNTKKYIYYRVPESHYRYIVRREIIVNNHNDNYNDMYFNKYQKNNKQHKDNKHVVVDTWSTPNGDDETDWLRN